MPLLNVPLDDPMVQEAYEFIDRVALKYQLKNVLKNRRPFSQGEIATILDGLRRDGFPLTESESKRLARLDRFLSDKSSLLRAEGGDYRFDFNLELGELTTHRTESAHPSGTEYAQQLRPIVSGRVRDDFVFLTDLRFYMRANTILPNTVRIEVEEDLKKSGFTTSGLVPAYAKFKLPWFELLIGRENVSWGPGRRGNLLLSANPLPMDMIQIRAQYRKIGFNAFTAIAKSPLDEDKILSTHRLDFNLWDRGNLGIAEAVLIGKNAFEFRFLNPFSIYTVTESAGGAFVDEKAETSRGNLLVSGDLELRIFRNLALYGEVMIDDYQLRVGLVDSFRSWGSKFGVQLGLQMIDPLSINNADLRIEYAFINQFAYTHRRPINTYTHFDRVIGHEIGSDTDDLWIHFKYWLTDKLSGTLTCELQRHGEGSATKPHPLDAPDDQWEFLSGIAESTYAFSMEVKYHTIAELLLGVRYQFSHIVNFNHQMGDSANQHEVILSAFYRL